MNRSTLLVFTVLLLFSLAYSKSVGDFVEYEDMADDYGQEERRDEVQRRGYYWMVSGWGPCKCSKTQGYGVQSRNVSCTTKPCHFIRAPRRQQACQCSD